MLGHAGIPELLRFVTRLEESQGPPEAVGG